MAKALRYKGEFLSRKGITWCVELLQDDYMGDTGDLTFDADEALVIEWEHRDKEEVLCGSEATIKIISPGDRTYADLYTIEVGRIRMDVYRDGMLYWSGALDPEFYEEPYQSASGYTVALTFSDFGILDRLKYNLSGMQTLQAILSDALERSSINYSGVDTETYTSTYFTDGTKATLSALSVRSDNFFDEDGEASTMKEVLEGIFQPLAMKMVQRAGKVYVFDLNGLHAAEDSNAVSWSGDTQTMSTDKVANNVKVSFSPYSSSDLLDGDLEYGGDCSVESVNLLPAAGASYYSYYPEYGGTHKAADGSWDYNYISFTIFLSNKATGLQSINNRVKYFHILPLVGGPSECSGVAWSFYSGGHSSLASGLPKQVLNPCTDAYEFEVLKTDRVFLPSIGSDADSYRVRLTLETLIDARYNPFTDANDGNESGNYEAVKATSAWVFIPVGVTIYDAAGSALCHYVNSPIAKTSSIGLVSYARGTWESGAASFGDAWLEYYSTDDQKNDSGIQGWKANRHCIGRPDDNSRKNADFGTGDGFVIYDSFLKMADGEYMPYPTQGGYMEVTVYAGMKWFKYGETSTIFDYSGDDVVPWLNHPFFQKKEWYSLIRWMLYKAPKVEVVRNDLKFDEAELDDIEYSGYINKAAKEEISIDTICGTAETSCPTAKGIYSRATDGQQIQQLMRAGVTDHPERLLIGTLYSQFASRKTVLSGEADIETGGIGTHTEANQQGRMFMLTADRQDTIKDTSEAEYTEFNADEYEAIEEVE